MVRAYGDAVHAGDCVTADALVVSSGRSWCGDVEINSMRITETTSEKRATESGDGPRITRVWVEMNVSGGDSSLPEGQMLWSLLLDRVGPEGAWRIYDQGMG